MTEWKTVGNLAVDYFAEDKSATTNVPSSAAELAMRHIDGVILKSMKFLADGTFSTQFLSTSPAPKGLEKIDITLPNGFQDRLREARTNTASFAPICEWDGYVTEVTQDVFRARIIDITSEESVPEEEVEIPREELDETSQAELSEGRYFRWSIGYDRDVSGRKTRVSRIIVRRLPALRRTDVEDARKKAMETAQHLSWD